MNSSHHSNFPIFHLLHLKNVPIEKQLQLEESLLRGESKNFCLINEGSSPAIVMGISGKKEELIDIAQAEKAGIPILKRFSGGGTVIVDEETLFVTFICEKKMHPFPGYPEAILRWTGSIYKEAFPQISLLENDYIIGNKKCGGNAQYIRKERWLHHTSFLWHFKKEYMQLLLHPPKTPSYRQGRDHLAFLTPLSAYFPSKEKWIEQLKSTLARRYSIKFIKKPLQLRIPEFCRGLFIAL